MKSAGDNFWFVCFLGLIQCCRNIIIIAGKFFMTFWVKLGFPMGRDSSTFWDKGTEVPSLSWDKGTTGQAQNLAKIVDGTQDKTITIFLSKSGV